MMNPPDFLLVMETEIRGADVTSNRVTPLGSNEELTEWFDSTSAIIVPSAGGATVNESELGNVCCIVLAHRIITDVAIDNFFVVNQDTAPGRGGTF